MNKSRVTVTSNARSVARALEEGVNRGLNRVGIRWAADAKQAITDMVYSQPQGPSGYQRTGRLRSSITFATPTVQAPTPEWTPPAPEGLTVVVGTNVEYAPFVHEGVNAQEVQVPQHTVREHQRTMTHVFGRDVQPFVVTVQEHTRGPYTMRVSEREPKKFIEAPLLQNLDAYRNLLHDSINSAFREAS